MAVEPISITTKRHKVFGPLNMNSLTESWLLRKLRNLEVGQLRLRLPGGSERLFTGRDPGPSADITILHNRFYRRLLTGGDIGFAEAYMDGDWETSDLAALLTFAAANHTRLGSAFSGHAAKRLAARLGHALRSNSQTGSKRNIAHHYDLGNSFYAAWLDSTMTYSSGVFESADDNLEATQFNKYRRLADLANIRPGQEVLEIGCGWGGFAIWAARERDCKVTAITISQAQHDFAQKRVQEFGLQDRITLRLQDYRDLPGTFDAIVSIEMLEAVGERYWQLYFDKVRDCLKPGGRAALQVITIDDCFFADYRNAADFIQQYVFPGGFLPSVEALEKPLSRSDLKIVEDNGYGLHYERTLDIWHRRFLNAWPEISKLGFDERFARMWRYYFAYCQAGFSVGRIDLRQLALVRC